MCWVGCLTVVCVCHDEVNDRRDEGEEEAIGNLGPGFVYPR